YKTKSNSKDEFSKFIKIIKNIPKFKCVRPKDEAYIAEKYLTDQKLKLYVNILETGLFQYLTYSHRSSNEYSTNLKYGYRNENEDIKKNYPINENEDINKNYKENNNAKKDYKIIFMTDEKKLCGL
ncbi:33519_t:CDS:1, partial [Racocetra persica]